MLKIVLIRPGSTEFDQQGRILGTLDVPLSDTGNTEVDHLVDQIRDYDLEIVYTSPCQSADQTARRIAAALGVKCKSVEQLKNIDHGLWQGMLVDEVKRKQPKVFKRWQEQPEAVCPPEGEMVAAAQKRVEATLLKIAKKYKNGTIGIVVPEPLASLIGCVLRHSEIREGWKTNGAGGSWEVIDVEPAARMAQ